MDWLSLAKDLLPIAVVVLSAAQSVAHHWIAFKGRPDHGLIIDQVVTALGKLQALRVDPAQAAQANLVTTSGGP